jgi:L-threonylcarbamoyladenylate synthase
MTKWIDLLDHEGIAAAATALAAGELVAFPTETVYGLGANALSAEAVAGIFKAKGRPSDNPLIVHIGDFDQVDRLVREVDARARQLMEAFWPGPLTLVFEKADAVPEAVTAGLHTVGIRMPSHPVALELLRKAGVPVAAPSANLSGKPSPTDAAHVMADLEGKVAYVVDGGPCDVGLESTVLDLTEDIPTILRPGGVTLEAIARVIGEVRLDPGLSGDARPKSPGMKYRHYAPEGRVILFTGDGDRIGRAMEEALATAKAGGQSVGLVLRQTRPFAKKADRVYLLPDVTDAQREIFRILRAMDDGGIDVILIEGYPPDDAGLAIMNRLAKAAAEHRHFSTDSA